MQTPPIRRKTGAQSEVFIILGKIAQIALHEFLKSNFGCLYRILLRNPHVRVVRSCLTFASGQNISVLPHRLKVQILCLGR